MITFRLRAANLNSMLQRKRRGVLQKICLANSWDSNWNCLAMMQEIETTTSFWLADGPWIQDFFVLTDCSTAYNIRAFPCRRGAVLCPAGIQIQEKKVCACVCVSCYSCLLLSVRKPMMSMMCRWWNFSVLVVCGFWCVALVWLPYGMPLRHFLWPDDH